MGVMEAAVSDGSFLKNLIFLGTKIGLYHGEADTVQSEAKVIRRKQGVADLVEGALAHQIDQVIHCRGS